MPSTGSTLYTGPIAVASSETIRAVAIAPAHPESASALADYTITVGTSGNGAVAFGNSWMPSIESRESRASSLM